MSNINEVSKNFSTADLKMGRANEGRKKSDFKETGESPATLVNRLIVELNLNVKVESKDRFGTQAGIKALSGSSGIDLSQLTYNGKPITELSQGEANALISEDGFFGVTNTARRIFDFVAGKAGDDPEKLQVARDAVLKGFKEAENSFGGTLPDISYKTLEKLLAMIDEKIRTLGGSVVNVKA
ncbi:MAG: hypothetical protein C4560_07900 [Nitrospiraceae bacterium]|nr:MAG: hypothetical protein C4560_07900 [Nitrospiraceae bacterium]